jgi:transposase
MEARTQNAAPILTTIGIDIGKDVFHIVGFDADGKIALRRKIKRLALAETFKRLPPCVVGMENCLSAHLCLLQLARRLRRRPNVAEKRGVLR